MKCTPITLVDIKHSFLMYTNIISNNRVSFKTKILAKYVVVNNFMVFVIYCILRSKFR